MIIRENTELTDNQKRRVLESVRVSRTAAIRRCAPATSSCVPPPQDGRSGRTSREQSRDYCKEYRRYHSEEGEIQGVEQDGAQTWREAHHSPGLHQQEHSEQESHRGEQHDKQGHLGVVLR